VVINSIVSLEEFLVLEFNFEDNFANPKLPMADARPIFKPLSRNLRLEFLSLSAIEN
jgi:hypothetical protein